MYFPFIWRIEVGYLFRYHQIQTNLFFLQEMFFTISLSSLYKCGFIRRYSTSKSSIFRKILLCCLITITGFNSPDLQPFKFQPKQDLCFGFRSPEPAIHKNLHFIGSALLQNSCNHCTKNSSYYISKIFPLFTG